MYHCDKCNKSFEKRKAYIGHCSSHNRGESYRTGRKKSVKLDRPLICKYCSKEHENFKSLGGHEGSCRLNPNYENKIKKLISIGKNRRLSDETRQKISKSRKHFLDKNPGNIPYLLNHSSKESYPERLFREALEKEGIDGWIQEYPVLRYSLDFAFVDLKIDVEIDGGTHKLDEVYKKDVERDQRLKDLGWVIYRIDANDVKYNIDKHVLKIKEIILRGAIG